MINIFIINSYKKNTCGHKKGTSMCYVQNNMHIFIDLSEHALQLVTRENSIG